MKTQIRGYLMHVICFLLILLLTGDVMAQDYPPTLPPVVEGNAQIPAVPLSDKPPTNPPAEMVDPQETATTIANDAVPAHPHAGIKNTDIQGMKNDILSPEGQLKALKIGIQTKPEAVVIDLNAFPTNKIKNETFPTGTISKDKQITSDRINKKQKVDAVDQKVLPANKMTQDNLPVKKTQPTGSINRQIKSDSIKK